MKCKKSLMGLAAFLILIFHFYIPFGESKFEIFIWQSAYYGVDLFFFLSAYSLGMKDKIKYGTFLTNRLCYIYVPFAIMTLIATIHKHWTFERFIKILVGVEFYNKGGGAFLWFVTAIMLLYLLAPLFVGVKRKYGIMALPILLLFWLLLAVIFQHGFKQETLFIVINRLPIFIIGLFYEEYRKLDLKQLKLPIAIISLVLGCILVNKWGLTVRLSKPFWDMFFILAIPMVVGIVGIADALSERVKIHNIPFALLGQITLELYGFQMIYGNEIEMKIYMQTRNGFLSFVVNVIALIAIATLFHFAMKYIRILIKKLKENLNNEKINS